MAEVMTHIEEMDLFMLQEEQRALEIIIQRMTLGMARGANWLRQVSQQTNLSCAAVHPASLSLLRRLGAHRRRQRR